MRGGALQTFKNISSRSRESLTEILTVFRRKYVKPQSMATAKHKFQQLVFNPANQKLIDFWDELQKLATDAFGVAAQAIIEQFIYAKMPPHLNKSINQAHFENGTYEQNVTHLERELKLNSSEYPDEIQMNTVMHKKQIDGNQDNAGNINSDTNDSNPNNNKNDKKSRGQNEPLRREMLCWSQCSKQATSPEEKTSRTGGTRQYNWLCPSNSPKSQQKCHIFTPEQWLTDRRPTEDYSTNPLCCLAATSGDICG